MDSKLDARSQNDMIAIKEVLKSGVIRPAEISARLEAFIEHETRKPAEEIDAELVTACEKLLWELHARKTSSLMESHRQKQLTSLQAYWTKKAKPKPLLSRKILHIAIVSATIVALMFAGDTMLRHQWLMGTQSDNNQQLVVEGKKINPGLVESGVASIEREIQEIQTQDIHEAIAVLGFVPPMPTNIPNDWVLLHYYAIVTSSVARCSAVYQHSEEAKVLIYEFARYTDVLFAREEIEQNQQGDLAILPSGQKAYVTENVSNGVCVWSDKLDLFLLTGPLASEALLEIAESIE